MSTKTARKSKVVYGRSMKGYLWYVLDSYGKVIMRVGDWNTALSIDYDYGTCVFTDGFAEISCRVFLAKVHEIQRKYGVKFSIKTKWGTNAESET